MRKISCILLSVTIVLLIVLIAEIKLFSSEKSDKAWAYAVENVICIGDSLTSGSYLGGDTPGDIQQNYPWYIGRMLNADVTNAGFAGYSASDWYSNKLDEYDFSEYDAAIIWFGTNNGIDPLISTDVKPYVDSGEYAMTEMGYYCRIIDQILSENPDMLIVLMQVFASKGDVGKTNEAIIQIADYYGFLVVDSSSLSMDQLQLHAGMENPHFGKAGNIAVADLLVSELNKWMEENPLRCEFNHKLK